MYTYCLNCQYQKIQNQKPTFLDLGWVVDEQLHPKYWVAHPNYWLENKDSDPKDSDMARIPTEDMDTHTIIIAQSGSGKSFFLGRLVEEIMLKSDQDV